MCARHDVLCTFECARSCMSCVLCTGLACLVHISGWGRAFECAQDTQMCTRHARPVHKTQDMQDLTHSHVHKTSCLAHIQDSLMSHGTFECASHGTFERSFAWVMAHLNALVMAHLKGLSRESWHIWKVSRAFEWVKPHVRMHIVSLIGLFCSSRT